MTVTCEIRSCRAERPLKEMRVMKRYAGKPARYRCKCHDAGFHHSFFEGEQAKIVKCNRCKRSKRRDQMQIYPSGKAYKCKDQTTCVKSSSSTTSI